MIRGGFDSFSENSHRFRGTERDGRGILLNLGVVKGSAGELHRFKSIGEWTGFDVETVHGEDGYFSEIVEPRHEDGRGIRHSNGGIHGRYARGVMRRDNDI